jgi:hypothetical protein
MSKVPTFNHVAMSVPSEALAGESREALLRFYGEVFGWTEMPTMGEEGKLLVFRVHSNEQFVYLAADDDPMSCPGLDHFGLSVGTPEELNAVHERALKFQESDPLVEIVEPHVEDFKAVVLHNFYVRYRLPMMIELQCYEWAEGLGPDSMPDG